MGGHVGEHELWLADRRWPQLGGFAPYLATIDSAAEVPPAWACSLASLAAACLTFAAREDVAGCWRLPPRWPRRCGSPVLSLGVSADKEVLALLAAALGRAGPAALAVRLPGGITLRSDIGRVCRAKHLSERSRPADPNAADMARDWRGPSD